MYTIFDRIAGAEPERMPLEERKAIAARAAAYWATQREVTMPTTPAATQVEFTLARTSLGGQVEPVYVTA